MHASFLNLQLGCWYVTLSNIFLILPLSTLELTLGKVATSHGQKLQTL